MAIRQLQVSVGREALTLKDLCSLLKQGETLLISYRRGPFSMHEESRPRNEATLRAVLCDPTLRSFEFFGES